MMKQPAIGLLLLFGLGVSVAAVAEVTVYRGATLIDGTHSGAIASATIVVEGERIVGVGTDAALSDGATVVDLAGKWVVPGLIDAHIHFMTSGRMYTRPAFFDLTDKVPYEEEVEWIKRHLPETLHAFMCSGVTGVISLGGPSLEYKARELAETMTSAPTVFVGHGVIVPMPRFLAEAAIPPWDGELTLKPATSVGVAREYVADAAAQKADLIKTALDDRGSLLNGLLMKIYDWQEMQSTVVETAAEKNLRVTTHAHALEYARRAVELGAASLQHIPSDQPIDDEFIGLLKEKDVILAPTLAIYKRTFVELIAKELDLVPIENTCSVPGVVESWAEPVPPLDDLSESFVRRREMSSANLKMLYDNGVTLAVATDSGMIGLAAGSSMHLELRAMNRAGLPPDYLIHAATLNSARLAGKEDDYGSVEVGKFADFLVLSENPLESIANLQAIELVVKHGEAFTQDALIPEAVPAIAESGGD